MNLYQLRLKCREEELEQAKQAHELTKKRLEAAERALAYAIKDEHEPDVPAPIDR